MNNHRCEFRVATMCRVLRASRSGFYAWLHKPLSDRAIEDQRLLGLSRRGNCWDNAVAESFFSSLKTERVKNRIYKTRDLAKADIFDYIEMFCNRTRRHSHLGGVSPEACEAASQTGSGCPE